MKNLLGQGAMGTVYRAAVVSGRRGLKPGDEVALKILAPRFALDQTAVRRFKREAGVGLGAPHPGIARVFEIGSLRTRTGERLYFIVQELLEGQSLREVLDRSGRLSEDLVRLVGKQVAEALAFVHRKGIVHRDLKPANLFMDAHGNVKVMDFGLAKLVHTEDIETPATLAPSSLTGTTSAGRFVGTVAYASPEQLEGRSATAHSDLYSLGLILFEMAAGCHPFARPLLEGFDAYVTAVQTRSAPPLTEVEPHATYFLERLVAVLLERNPELRLGDAGEVAQRLSEGESSRWWREFISEQSAFLSASRRQLVVRRRTRLADRQGELTVLRDAARALVDAGHGGALWVEGEAGSGKTRLLDEMARSIEESRARTYLLVTRSGGVDVPLPHYALRTLVRDTFALNHLPREEAHRLLAQRVDRLLEQPRRLREQFVRHVLEPEHEGSVSGEVLEGLYVEFFRGIAQETPTVLVMEGVHHASPETLAVLLRLARLTESVPLLLLVTARNDQPPAPEAAALLGQLRQRLRVVALQALGPAPVESMLRDLALPFPDLGKVAQRVHRLSEGNPLLVLELIDHLERRGDLHQLASARPTWSSLPSRLDDLFAAVRERLSNPAWSVVEAAAVLGGTFRIAVLREIVQLDPVPFATRFAALERENVVVSQRGEEARFRHGAFRRYVLDHTPAARRTAVHRQAAEYYDRESSLPVPPARTSLKAALHASLGGQRDILLRHLQPAAELLNTEGQVERIARLARSAMEWAQREPRALELLCRAGLLRGEVAHRRGQRDEEWEAFSAVIRAAKQLGDSAALARAYQGLGRLSSRTGHFLVAESYLRSGLAEEARAPQPGDSARRSLILLDLAESLLWRGDESLCAEVLDTAEKELPQSPAALARYCKERGNLLLELERFDEARTVLRRGRSLLHGHSHRALQRALLLSSARLFRELADFHKSRRACAAARSSAAADGDLRHLAFALSIEGDVLARMDRAGDAAPLLARSLRIARNTRDEYLTVNLYAALSNVYRSPGFARRSLPKAIRHARRAIFQARNLAVGRLETRGHAALAECYRALGRRRWALAITRRAVRDADAAGVRRRRAAEIYFVHSGVLRDLGRAAEARVFLEQASALMEQRLRGVGQEAVRQRLREGDPLFRAILEAVEATPERADH